MVILVTNKMVYTTITYFFSNKSVRNVYVVARIIMRSRTTVEYCPFLAVYATTLDVSLTPSPEASSFQPAMPTTSLYHTSHATQPPPLRHHSTPLPHSTLVTPSLPRHNSMPNTPLCHFTTPHYYVTPSYSMFTAELPQSLAAMTVTHSIPPAGGLHSIPPHAVSHAIQSPAVFHSVPALAGPQPIPSASLHSILLGDLHSVPPAASHSLPLHADPHSIPPAISHSAAPEVLHSIPPAISHSAAPEVLHSIPPVISYSVLPPEVLHSIPPPAGPQPVPHASPHFVPPAGPQPVPHASPRFVPPADPHSMPPAGPHSIPLAHPNFIPPAGSHSIPLADPNSIPPAGPHFVPPAGAQPMQATEFPYSVPALTVGSVPLYSAPDISHLPPAALSTSDHQFMVSERMFSLSYSKCVIYSLTPDMIRVSLIMQDIAPWKFQSISGQWRKVSKA